MPPTSICPRCGCPSPPNVTFCASCGSHISGSSPSSAKGWKLLLGAVALFAGLLWVSVLYTQQSSPTRLAGTAQPQAMLSSDARAAEAAPPTPPPSFTLTTAQHLAEAKRALADGYKPNKDAQKAQWGEVAAARWHLKAIGTTAPEYQEAQELLKEVVRRERQVELARKQAEKKEESDATADADAVNDDNDDSSSEPSSASSTSSSTPAYSSPSASTATRQTPPASTAGGTSSSDYYTNSRGVQVQRPTFSENGPPPGATAQCRDGSYSFSQSRRGTCSHHGGVSRWL